MHKYTEFFVALANKQVQVRIQVAPNSKPIWFDVMQDNIYNIEFIIPLTDAVLSVIKHGAPWRIKPEPITLYRVEVEGTRNANKITSVDVAVKLAGVDISSDWHTSEDHARRQISARGYCTDNAKVFTKEVTPE